MSIQRSALKNVDQSAAKIQWSCGHPSLEDPQLMGLAQEPQVARAGDEGSLVHSLCTIEMVRKRRRAQDASKGP